MQMNSRHLGWIALGILSLLLVGSRAEATESQVALTQGTGFEADPVAVQGLTDFEAWLEIYVIDERDEKQIAQDVRHRKITITWGVPDDGILNFVGFNELGWTKTLLFANKWVLDKDGPNQNMTLVIAPVGKFLTVGLGKPVKIEAEVTFTDDTVIIKTLDTEVDAIDVLVKQSPWSVENTTREGLASTADLCPFNLPPFSSDQDGVPEGVTLTASITNGNITVGPCLDSTWLHSYACRVHPGDPARYDDPGNRNALNGGTLTVTAADAAGNKRTCNITVQVTDAKCRRIWDNVPTAILVAADTSFGVRGGDAESTITVGYDCAEEWLGRFVDYQMALVTAGLWALIPDAKPTLASGNTTNNDDGSVTQNYTMHTTSVWMAIVEVVKDAGGVAQWNIQFTITPNDGGPLVQFDRGICFGD